MGERDQIKRKRESNFSKNEQQVLISIVSKYSHIVEDKKTDRTSMDAKSNAWKDIEREFNSSNSEGVLRSGEKLKKCFNNKKHDLRIIEAEKSKMRYLQKEKEPDETYVDSEIIREFYEGEKRKVKKVWADEKKYITQTGMGTLPTKKKDENEDLLLSIINKKTIYGLDSHPFDSDNQSPIINNGNVNIDYIYESDNDDNEESKKNECCGTPQRLENANWKSGAGFSAKQLTTPLTSVLNRNEMDQASSSGEKKKNCSRRRPTNSVKILTSSKFAEKYEILLDKRLILVTKQTEDFKEEVAFKRRERKLKLELLQLQIEAIKK